MLATWTIDLEPFRIETINEAFIVVGLSQKAFVDISDLYYECCRIENIEPPYSAHDTGGNARLNHSEVARIAARSGMRINSPSMKLLKGEGNQPAKLEGPKELSDEEKMQLDEFEIRTPCRTGKAASMSQNEIEAERKRQIDATIAAFRKECEPKVKAGSK